MPEKLVDLTGQVFGAWKVIERIPNSPHNTYWRCVCICGKEKNVRSFQLRKGIALDCGCIRYAKQRKRPYEALYNSFVRRARAEVRISYEEFLSLTTIKNCTYCSKEVTWSMYNPGKNGSAANLDRKDCNKVYYLDNIVVCCLRCNRLKWNTFTYEQTKELIELISKWEEQLV